MEIPTIKSCGPFSLTIVGLMIGFFQLVYHVVAFLFAVRFGLMWIAPITLVGIAMNVAWIYGIQEKKVMYMIPAFIPFVVATLSLIISVSIFPIVVAIQILASGPILVFQERGMFGGYMATILLTAIVTYLTIVEYSLCKSLEETYRRESIRLPYTPSCPPQTLTR